MGEMQQITLDQWLAWKEDIREKLRETAGNFVHIGFRLKQIRDSGMLGGAADIFEFALNEYGLSKSSTSRFIAINEKFSEGGNSLELKEEYRAIGSSKLAEMLTLTDAECGLITERTTVKEIRELKNFSRQQPSEAEAGDAQGGSVQAGDGQALTPLQKCLADYFKDKKGMLNAVVGAVHSVDYKAAAELMNPTGYGTHKKGICFMFMYDYATGVKVKYLTEPEPVTMPWTGVLMEAFKIYAAFVEAGETDVHGAYYGRRKEEPEKIPETDASKTGKTAENQNAEDSGEAPVATSQREGKTGENSGNTEVEEPIGEGVEEADGEAEGQEPEKEAEADASKTAKTAENQNAAGSVEVPAVVATSQQEDGSGDEDDTWNDEPEDAGDASREPSGPEDMEKWERGAQRERDWIMVEEAENMLEQFVCEYDRVDAADGAIPPEKLKDAYGYAVNLAAGIESLLLDA